MKPGRSVASPRSITAAPGGITPRPPTLTIFSPTTTTATGPRRGAALRPSMSAPHRIARGPVGGVDSGANPQDRAPPVTCEAELLASVAAAPAPVEARPAAARPPPRRSASAALRALRLVVALVIASPPWRPRGARRRREDIPRDAGAQAAVFTVFLQAPAGRSAYDGSGRNPEGGTLDAPNPACPRGAGRRAGARIHRPCGGSRGRAAAPRSPEGHQRPAPPGDGEGRGAAEPGVQDGRRAAARLRSLSARGGAGEGGAAAAGRLRE